MYVMRKFACMKKYKNDIKDVQQQGFVVKVIEMCWEREKTDIINRDK